jgi:hypothetical protein
MHVILLILLLPALALAQSEFVTGKATPEEVYRKVVEAAKFLVDNGEAGLKEFEKSRHRFVWKNTHVWVTKCEDNYCLPSPQRRKLGLISETRCLKTGKLYILELCFQAGRNPGGAWVEYWQSRPGFTEPQRKISFMKQVPDSPYQVVSDIYDPSTPLEALNKLVNNN